MTEEQMWPEANAVALLHERVLAQDAVSVRDQLAQMARNLERAHAASDPAVTIEIANWHPGLTGASSDDGHRKRIMAATFGRADAEITIAREHGFDDWDDVEMRGAATPDPLFEATVDAFLAGDEEAVAVNVASRPALVTERSPYGHGATLLHYAGSNGVEIRRQRVPPNLVALVETLVAAGAAVDATARLYGKDCTTYELAATSGHPARVGIADALLGLLERLGGKPGS